MPLFVLRIAADGPAAADGRLRVGDRYLFYNFLSSLLKIRETDVLTSFIAQDRGGERPQHQGHDPRGGDRADQERRERRQAARQEGEDAAAGAHG